MLPLRKKLKTATTKGNASSMSSELSRTFDRAYCLLVLVSSLIHALPNVNHEALLRLHTERFRHKFVE